MLLRIGKEGENVVGRNSFSTWTGNKLWVYVIWLSHWWILTTAQVRIVAAHCWCGAGHLYVIGSIVTVTHDSGVGDKCSWNYFIWHSYPSYNWNLVTASPFSDDRHDVQTHWHGIKRVRNVRLPHRLLYSNARWHCAFVVPFTAFNIINILSRIIPWLTATHIECLIQSQPVS